MAQLVAGGNPGSRWSRWPARPADAGSLVYLGNPEFSHGAGIWPPHLKHRSVQVCGFFLMLITARLFQGPSLQNSLSESGWDLYLTCAEPVCGQGLDREWQLIHQSEQQHTHEEERAGSAHTLQVSSTSHLWDVAAQLSPLLGRLDLPGVFEDTVPGQRAA